MTINSYKATFAIMLFMLMFSAPSFAMSVTQMPDYMTYKPVGWNVFTGVPIDDSAFGLTVDLPLGGSNHTSFNIDSPDTTNPATYVWVRMINASPDDTENPDLVHLVTNPPDIRVRLLCNNNGGIYNITKTFSNYTWNTGYELFLLQWDVEELQPVAYPSMTGDLLNSPTGRDLWVKRAFCYVEVFPSDWENIDPYLFVRVSFWGANPSRDTLCNIDSAVSSIQSSTLGIVDINYQIWVILFDIFSVVVILVSIFGIPILLIKLIRWIFDEIKKMTGGKKVF